MKLSNMYLKTYKECPLAVSNESIKLLYRGGFLKYIEDGSYSYTPLGNLFFDEMVNLLQDHFHEYKNIKINGDKVSGLNAYLSDLKSYKDLPFDINYFTKNKNRYYKFKDGLLNPKKENIIKCVKISSKEDVISSLATLKEKIKDLLDLCNIKDLHFRNEKEGLRYFYETNYPLREVIFCEKCGYGERIEEGMSSSEKELSTEGLKEREDVYTPNVGTIEDLVGFLNISSKKLIKTLLFDVKGEIIAVLLRGDRSINLGLLAKYLKVKESEIKMADEEQVKLVTGANIGFAGPIGLNKVSKVLGDHEILSIKNAVIGANKTDYHIKNINYEKDFKIDGVENFKLAQVGQECIICSAPLKTFEGISFIDVDILEKNMHYLNNQGREEKLYTLEIKFYIDRLFSLIVEENKDEMGIKWPKRVSYFDYHIIIGNIKNEKEKQVGEKIYEALGKKGYTVLLDDRKERIGFKFKDAELIGIPRVIVVGKEIINDVVEIRDRVDNTSKNMNIEELISVE